MRQKGSAKEAVYLSIRPRTASRDHHQCGKRNDWSTCSELINIGITQMKEFEKKLPDGFYGSIPVKVKTMAATKN